MQCGNMTEFGMAEDHRAQRHMLFCFYILLFNVFMSFQAKIYEIKMCLLLYFIILNHRVGIHPTTTQVSPKQHYSVSYVT